MLQLTVVSDNFFPVEEMLFEAAKAFWKLGIKYWQDLQGICMYKGTKA
jgi:hypothetical protein